MGVAFGLLSIAFAPASALAGPVEQFAQVLLHPARPDVIAVRYDNTGGGLLISREGGRSFALLCSAAAGIARGGRPSSAALAGSGQLLLGAFEGLQRDDGQACGFAPDPALGTRWVTDLALHPRDPGVVFAVTGNAAPAQNGIYSSANGAPFVPIGELADLLVSRLRVVELADGKLRFYESALASVPAPASAAGTEPRYMIRVSDDGGRHFTEHPWPLGGLGVRLEAVDPGDPDAIVVSATHSDQTTTVQTLFVSRDAGASFREYASFEGFSGIVIGEDRRVFITAAGSAIADAPKGLWRADDLDEPPVLLDGGQAMTCLGRRGGDGPLFACTRYAFGRVDEESGELQELVKLTKVDRLVTCAGDDVRARCEQPMLDGYCGVSHFPCAPVCDLYPQALGALELDPSFCSAAAGAGAPPPIASATAGAAAPQVADARAPSPNDRPQSDDSRHVSACHVVAPGASGTHSSAAVLLFALVGFFACSNRFRAMSPMAVLYAWRRRGRLHSREHGTGRTASWSAGFHRSAGAVRSARVHQ
jgi:hypothetical protein